MHRPAVKDLPVVYIRNDSKKAFDEAVYLFKKKTLSIVAECKGRNRRGFMTRTQVRKMKDNRSAARVRKMERKQSNAKEIR